MKNLISKASDPDLDAARLDPADSLPDPASVRCPTCRRPSIGAGPPARAPKCGTGSQEPGHHRRFTRNGMLPALSAFGSMPVRPDRQHACSRQRSRRVVGTGLFGATFPEYAAGLSATVPMRNRSAQADNLRARLEEQQLRSNSNGRGNRSARGASGGHQPGAGYGAG